MRNNFNLNKLTSADYITLSRLLAAPVVVLYTLLGLKTAAGILIGIAMATDLFDGLIANQFAKKKYGPMLDSIADGAIFLSSVFSVAWFFTNFLIEHWVWIFLLLGIYLFQIAYAFIRYGRITTFHKYSAKFAAFPIGVFIITSYFTGPQVWLFYIACLSGLVAELEEIALITLLDYPRNNVKGIFWVVKGEHVQSESN